MCFAVLIFSNGFGLSSLLQMTLKNLLRQFMNGSFLDYRASTLFEMFPFCVLFQKDMTITSMGVSLRQIIPQIVGKKVTSYFELVKPLIEFNFENIESRSNNMFELATQEEISKLQGQSWQTSFF